MAKKIDEDEGLSLDDAFSDDDDVEYAKPKARKIEKKQQTKTPETISEESNTTIKASKPIERIKKGDKIKVDSLTLEVDSHYVLMDHGSTKEMTIELFDPKTDKDYQIRYFNDQVETSIEFYKLEEIVYNRTQVKNIEW